MTIKVELFTAPGCNRCSHARESVQRVVAALATDGIEWRAVNVLDEIDYAVSLGILSTPAIAIDGRLVFSLLPGLKAIRRELQGRLRVERSRSP